MSIIKTEAFVLKNFNYGDTSKIVTLYTKDHGKMNAIVKGARNYKSKYCGVFDTMNYINAVIYKKETRDLQNISSAENIRSFKNITSDLEKLSAAYFIVETLNKATSEYDVNPLLFSLLQETIAELNETITHFIEYAVYFQVHLSKINGYGLSSDNIETELETFYRSNEVRLNGKHHDVLNFLTNTDVKGVGNIKSDRECITVLKNFLDRYIAEHSDHKRFYKSKKVFQELN